MRAADVPKANDQVQHQAIGIGPRIECFRYYARIWVESASHLVGRFDYLKASGRAEAQKVRDLVDAWFADYPTANQAEMRRRLRSRDDTLHRSAQFELFLHVRWRSRVELALSQQQWPGNLPTGKSTQSSK